MRPILAASIAVFHGDKLLLGRRLSGTSPGLWSLPGGRVELGERLHEAALRELAEETGVVADILEPADIVEFLERDEDGAVMAHFVIVAFAGIWHSGEAQAGAELSEIRWVDPATFDGLTVTPGLERAVQRAAALVHSALTPATIGEP